jgi:hypothetical protein
MAARVFTLEEAGDYFASRFVAVKYDMERGEGLELAKQFGVRAYPTFLIVRPDGVIAHRIVGKFEWPVFVEKLERGLNPKTSLVYLEEKARQGKLDNKGLLKYRQALEDAFQAEAVKKLTDESLEKMTDKERVQAGAWVLLADKKASPFGSKNYEFILDHREKLYKNVGRERVDAYLRETWSNFLTSINHLEGYPPGAFDAPPEQPAEQLQRLKQLVSATDVAGKEFLLARCDVAEAVLRKDRQGIMQAIEAALPYLPAGDNGIILTALPLQDRSRQAYAEMADLYEKYLKALPGEEQPEWVLHNVLIYRGQSRVGVYFEPFTLDEALAWGEKRWQSPVYVWCYTPGDAARGEMEANLFPREDVKKACKAVCVKYALDSPDGRRLAEKHGLQGATRVHLLLRPDGSEIARLTGTPDAEAFIDWLEKSLAPS